MSADLAARHLVLFARRPALGAGKRRLAASIGALAALRFQRFALDRLVRTLGADRRWTLWLCLTPDQSPRQRPRYELPQGRGDLGERLSRVTKLLPPGPIVIIGSDAPQITRTDIARAFRALGCASAVFGPAADGGFWLAGLNQRSRRRPPFNNVRWSSAHTLGDVLEQVRPAHFALLRELEDVDDAASLRRVLTHMRREHLLADF